MLRNYESQLFLNSNCDAVENGDLPRRRKGVYWIAIRYRIAILAAGFTRLTSEDPRILEEAGQHSNATAITEDEIWMRQILTSYIRRRRISHSSQLSFFRGA